MPDNIIETPNEETEEERLARKKRDFELAADKITQKMDELAAKGHLYKLLPEEVSMLNSFRKFKKGIKRVELFTWQTLPINPEDKLEAKVYGCLP